MKIPRKLLRATGIVLFLLMIATGAFMLWISKAEVELERSPTATSMTSSKALPTIPEGFERVFGGDAKIELLAYALNVPGQSANVWRNPATQAKFSDEQLLEAGAKPEHLDAPEGVSSPILSFLFRFEGVRHAWLDSSSLLDGRTEFEIQRASRIWILKATEGSVMRIDNEIVIWHDTAIQSEHSFQFGLANGVVSEQFSFEIAELPDMPNGRDVENLFEVRIPEVKTANPISVVLGAAQLRHELRVGPDAKVSAGAGKIMAIGSSGGGGSIVISGGSGATVSGTSISGSGISAGPGGGVISAGNGGSVTIQSGGSIQIGGSIRASGGSVVIGGPSGGSISAGSGGSGGVVLAGGVVSFGAEGEAETYHDLTVYELLQRYAETRGPDQPSFKIDPKTMTLIEEYGLEKSMAQKAKDWWNSWTPRWLRID